MKFNPDLIQKARKGEIAILNDGSVKELNNVLSAIWPAMGRANGTDRYYFKDLHREGDWESDEHSHGLESHSIKDFFLPDNPVDAEAENGRAYVDQPRTYKVTRGQMKEIWESAPIIARQSIRQDAEKMFSVFENEAEITGGDVAVIVRYFFEPLPDILKSIFPEYFHIPEGEPVLVRQEDGQDWNILISNGRGGAYTNGRLYGFSDTFKQIIPFTKNPPK